MADTSIARAGLGATTVNRKWYLDVDSAGSQASPTWVGVFGVTEFKPAKASTRQDTSDFSSAWKGGQVTALEWSLEGKFKRATIANSAVAYDPGQEFLRTKSDSVGVAARVHLRWYEMEPSGPRVEAYEGWGTVEWSEDGGGMDANSTVTFKVNGDGARTPITHPQTGTALLPIVATVTPAGQSVGEQVMLSGYNLGAVTAISFDSTAVVNFTIVDGQHIVAQIPTGAVGVGDVTVTSPAGTSTAVSYTTV